MKKIFRERTFCWIFNTLAIMMFFVLLYHCIGSTGRNSTTNMRDEHIYFTGDSILLNIAVITIALLALYFIGKLSDKLQSKKTRNIILAVACVMSALISYFWIYAGKFEPVADQLFVCLYADAFNNNDYAGLLSGGYIARYPQQLGFITLLRVFFAIFGKTNFAAFQYFSASMIPFIVLSGCKIVRILTNDNVKAELYYMIFIMLCFPMYAYTPYVYGDLISTVFSMLALWMFLAAVKQFSWWRAVLFGLFIGVAVQLRKNVLVLVLALGLVIVIKCMFQRTLKNFLLLLALAVGVLLMNLSVWALYKDVRPEDADSIPAIMYMVMGLNDDYSYPGWHNGYEMNTFNACGDDAQLATQKALEDMKVYIEIYKNDPAYMVDFFVRKMNSQWNAPMYQSMAMNTYFEEEQLPPVKQLYQYGDLMKLLEACMKVYQLLLYCSVFFWLLKKRNEIENIEKYALLIAVFGGFLFSFMWEAKTRYVMPYLFMQIPYMAMGITEITGIIGQKIHEKIPNRTRSQCDNNKAES